MSTPTPKTSPYKAPSIFSSVQNALAKGIHDQNFKSGAFRTSIPYSTSPTNKTSVIDAFNILLASPELSQSEKEVVKYCRMQFIHLRNRFPGSTPPKAGEAGDLEEKLKDLKEMFEKDAATREHENAPPSMQTVDDDDVPEHPKTRKTGVGKRVRKSLGFLAQ